MKKEIKNNLYNIQEIEKLDISNIWDMYKKYVNPGQVDLISSFGFGRDLVDYADGCWIYTKNKKKILDFTGGVGVLNHGHNHPRILKARIDYQNKKKMEVHKNYFSPYVAALAHNIAKMLPGDLNISYFPNSGAEAVEGALKLAYKFYGGARKSVLYSDISFHGKLLGSASITGSPELDFKFPEIPNAYSFKYNDINSLLTTINELSNSGKSDVYAIIIEPFNASSLQKCSKEFLIKLREICDKENIVLIFDEVYTGWAKTGELFYFMHYDLLPDILTYAKSFGGGKSSIAGYTCRDHIFKNAYGNLNDAILHSTTYNGFGEETVTSIEALNIILDDDYLLKSKRIYEQINSGLTVLQKKYPKILKEIRGAGALNGVLINVQSKILESITNRIPIAFIKDERFLAKLITASIISELYDEHNILTFYGSNRDIPLIISPSLIVTDDEIDYFLNALDKTLEKSLLHLVLKFVKNKFLKK